MTQSLDSGRNQVSGLSNLTQMHGQLTDALTEPEDVHCLSYLARGRDVSNPHLLEITNLVSASHLL